MWVAGAVIVALSVALIVVLATGPSTEVTSPPETTAKPLTTTTVAPAPTVRRPPETTSPPPPPTTTAAGYTNANRIRAVSESLACVDQKVTPGRGTYGVTQLTQCQLNPGQLDFYELQDRPAFDAWTQSIGAQGPGVGYFYLSPDLAVTIQGTTDPQQFEVLQTIHRNGGLLPNG